MWGVRIITDNATGQASVILVSIYTKSNLLELPCTNLSSHATLLYAFLRVSQILVVFMMKLIKFLCLYALLFSVFLSVWKTRKYQVLTFITMLIFLEKKQELYKINKVMLEAGVRETYKEFSFLASLKP